MADDYEPAATTEAEPAEEMTWNDFTVPQLKEELTVRGLETVGKKAELVARLEKYDSDMLTQQKQEEDNGDEFVVWNVDEEQDDTQDERDDHDDVEYVGASNGLKADEKQESSAGKEESSTADKSTTGDGEAKEPQPDFTVTPSKDADLMLLTWCGKQIPVPFRDEVQKDLRHCSKLQNVMMYPVHLVDVLSDTFRPLIESAINVSTELDEIVAGQAVTGYLRLKFSSTSEAARAVDTLKEYKHDGQELTIKFFSEDDSEGHVLSKIRKDEAERKGPLITRLIYVGNLPTGIAEEALKECFPDALRAIIPSKDKEESSEKSGGYAYMEYVSETVATEAAKKYQNVELEAHKLYVIKAMTNRMMSFGLLKDSLRKYWLEEIRRMEADKTKAYNKTPRELADLETKLVRMKQRIKKDNERREVLNIPVPESEVVDVPDSDTEKEKEKDAEATEKDDKPKEEGKTERHSHREDRSSERRRTPPRRRPSPPRYRGSYRGGGSRGGYRGGPPSYGGGRDGNADRLVDQLQELVGVLAHRERSSDYGGRGGYYDGPPSRGGRGSYSGGPSYRGDYHSSSSRFPPKRPSDVDYAPDRKRHAADDYYSGRGGGSYGSYGGPRRGGYY